MDIQIERKKGLRILFAKRSLPYWGGMLFLLFAAWLLLRDNASTLRVDAGTLSVAEVTQGDFNDYIRVTGQVEPITTVQLSPLEAGVVERLVVEEGASVRRGDVLVELSNPSLTLEILNSEAELAEKQNLLRNTLISMEQEKLTLRQNKAQLDLDVARKRRAFEQNDELYAHRLIAREEWLQAKEDWELAEKQRELNIERQIQDSLYRTVQVEQMEDNLANMRRNMQLIRQRIGNLAVKSPIDGEIGLLDVVLGQSVASGQKIGQVNDLSDFKVEAQIDEIYIDRVRTGLEASFERQDSNYRMRLRKVYPEVRNNVFRADFNFTGAYPANIRSGQTYYLHLQLGQPTEAVLVPRGTFYQTTGGAWIYVLSPRRRPRLQAADPHRPPESAVLRGARRTATGRAGHRLGLRVLRRQRRTAAEPPNKITPTIQNNDFVKPSADPNLFGLCRGGKTKNEIQPLCSDNSTSVRFSTSWGATSSTRPSTSSASRCRSCSSS